LSFWGFGGKEVLVVVDGGGGEGLVDSTSSEVTFPCRVWVSPAFELQVYAGAICEVGDRFGELQRFEIHDEFDGVPTTLTAIAVVEALIRGDTEGRGLFLVVGVGAEA
jgi:hypothetical protein